MEEPRKIQKEKSSVSKNDNGTMQNNEKTPVLEVLLNYYLLKNIFQHLNGRNLASAAMVCRSWLEAANNEKKTRGPCYFIEFNTEYSSNFLWNIRNIRIKPSIGFLFVLTYTNYDIAELVKNLPKHCETIILYNDGIIMEKEYNESPNMLCAFLPQIPNLRVKSFELPEYFIISRTAEYQEIISTIVNNEISTSNHETCFMLFCNQEGHETAQRWASAIQESQENKVVSVWGGVVRDIREQRAHAGLCREQTEIELSKGLPTSRCVAVLITGPIQTWSMILEWECNTEEQMEARLNLFKDKVKLKKHSIGFIFGSRFRQSDMFNEFYLNNDGYLESTIFKRVFPTVSLVGCLSFGREFGKTTAVDEKKERDNKGKQDCKKSKSWYNCGSTVFLILTYG